MLLVRMRMNIHTVVLTHTHTHTQTLLKSIKKSISGYSTLQITHPLSRVSIDPDCLFTFMLQKLNLIPT